MTPHRLPPCPLAAWQWPLPEDLDLLASKLRVQAACDGGTPPEFLPTDGAAVLGWVEDVLCYRRDFGVSRDHSERLKSLALTTAVAFALSDRLPADGPLLTTATRRLTERAVKSFTTPLLAIPLRSDPWRVAGHLVAACTQPTPDALCTVARWFSAYPECVRAAVQHPTAAPALWELLLEDQEQYLISGGQWREARCNQLLALLSEPRVRANPKLTTRLEAIAAHPRWHQDLEVWLTKIVWTAPGVFRETLLAATEADGWWPRVRANSRQIPTGERLAELLGVLWTALPAKHRVSRLQTLTAADLAPALESTQDELRVYALQMLAFVDAGDADQTAPS